MNKEPKEQKKLTRKEKYLEIFDPVLEAIASPAGGAEYLVSLGQDMDASSADASDSDKIYAVEKFLRNFVNLGNYNESLLSEGQTGELVLDLIESTRIPLGIEQLDGTVHEQLEQLQVAYMDAKEFSEGKGLDGNYFELNLAVQAYAFNEALQLGADPTYYRGNIAAGVAQMYPVREDKI